jgi:GTPase SAR1 family protein
MRIALLGPSGSGKTQLIQSMLLDMYRTKGGGSCFARIYIFSPSVLVDPAWIPVRKFCETVLRQDNDKEKFLFDTFDPAELDAGHHDPQEGHGPGQGGRVQEAVERPDHPGRCGRRPPHRSEREADPRALLPRAPPQAVRAHQHPALPKHRAQIRTQCTALFVFRLRSHLELEAVLEEVSATYDKKTIAGFYREATEEPFSFLYIRLEAKKPEDMFWERFEYRLLP